MTINNNFIFNYRIPVIIDVIDHNDHELKFNGNNYYATLIEDFFFYANHKDYIDKISFLMVPF